MCPNVSDNSTAENQAKPFTVERVHRQQPVLGLFALDVLPTHKHGLHELIMTTSKVLRVLVGLVVEPLANDPIHDGTNEAVLQSRCMRATLAGMLGNADHLSLVHLLCKTGWRGKPGLMQRCGVVWCNVVWFGVVWCGAV